MRVVSLCPSSTELVFDLGAGDELVGVTTFCVHPAEGVARIEKVGGTKTPDVARIAALEPDLVLLNEEENRREDAEALERAGLRCLTSFPRTVPETAEMVRAVGVALGRSEPAEALARALEQRAAEVEERARGREPVRYAYLIWRKPWMAAGADTYVDALLALAGGQNVFAETGERYPEITPQALAAARPDVVLLSSEPFPFQERHADELATATGLARERLALCDGEDLSWHGSRTLRGLDEAERCLERARLNSRPEE